MVDDVDTLLSELFVGSEAEKLQKKKEIQWLKLIIRILASETEAITSEEQLRELIELKPVC